MTSRIKRKIIQVGTSQAVTIPPDWIRKYADCQQVQLIYDDMILIFREDQAEKVDKLFETIITQTIQETIRGNEKSDRDQNKPTREVPP